MYIAHPDGAKKSFLSQLGSTHPPIQRRVSILRAMGQGAGFAAYEKAFHSVSQGGRALIPASALSKAEEVPVRAATAEPPQTASRTAARDFGDLMRVLNGYAFLTCACGLKIKVPQGGADKVLECPRCGVPVGVPTAQAPAQEVSAPDGPSLAVIRRGKGWQSFACGCGKLVQLSPAFAGTHVDCAACGKRTIIQ